jgi:hypothetical protein
MQCAERAVCKIICILCFVNHLLFPHYKVLHDKVREMDLSECEVSDSSLNVIASTCHLLRKIDLNAAKSPRTAVTTQGWTVNCFVLYINVDAVWCLYFAGGPIFCMRKLLCGFWHRM